MCSPESEKCGFEGSLDTRRHLIHGEVATYHACNRSSTKHSLMQHSRENNNVFKVCIYKLPSLWLITHHTQQKSLEADDFYGGDVPTGTKARQ